MTSKPIIACAIYTRKSSEEGLEQDFNSLDAQREACEAAGRHIPLVVENVRGAQKWVGRARWNFGSFYLWGDVPALMPMTGKARKNGGNGSWFYGTAAPGGGCSPCCG